VSRSHAAERSEGQTTVAERTIRRMDAEPPVTVFDDAPSATVGAWATVEGRAIQRAVGAILKAEPELPRSGCCGAYGRWVSWRQERAL